MTGLFIRIGEKSINVDHIVRLEANDATGDLLIVMDDRTNVRVPAASARDIREQLEAIARQPFPETKS